MDIADVQDFLLFCLPDVPAVHESIGFYFSEMVEQEFVNTVIDIRNKYI